MRRRRGWIGLGFSLVLELSACGGATPQPAQTLSRFAELVRARRDGEAYLLLDDSLRARVSEAQFTTMLEAERETVAARAERLANAPATTTARVRTHRAEPVTLQLFDDGWRIEGGVGVRPSARTPRDAALAFAQALDDRDWDATMRLLSRARRDEIGAQMRVLVEGLREDADADVIMRGMDRATVRLANGDSIEMVLENGEWRVDDLQ